MLENELDRLLNEDISSVINREKYSFDKFAEPFGKSLVLFGAGNLGRRVLARLRQERIEPLCFADNNPGLWGSDIDGIKVLSPEDAAEKYGDRAAFIVAICTHSGHRFALTKKKLTALNCRKVISFVSFFWKYSDSFLPDYYIDLPHKIIENADSIKKAFNLLGDEDSQNTFLTQLKWRIIENYDELPGSSITSQYFPDDIFQLTSDEIFVDCGAFNGDTIKEFLQRQGESFGKIIAFEPDPLNFSALSKYVENFSSNLKNRVAVFQKAVGLGESKLKFFGTGTPSSLVSERGDIEVDCIDLDHTLATCNPTYIKMDIEGAEIDALAGARRIIEKDRPVLGICVYHRQDHLWRIPLLISSLSNDYKIFLRPYSDEGWELVCYAVPINRLKNI